MGRPSKVDSWLTEDGLLMLTHWKRNDLTDAQIAKKLGIAAPTLIDWKRKYPQISEALKKGLEYCIADAEKALISKFKPYTYEEERMELWQVPTGRKKANGQQEMEIREQHVVRTKKTVMPDTTAIIFFLKAKGGWRDNYEITDNAAVDKLDKILEGIRIDAEESTEKEQAVN